LLGKHIFPFLGSRDIESITAEDMRNCLARIWQSTPSSAKKVRTYVQKIFQWSMAKGLCQRLDNPAMMDGPLGVLLEPYQKNRKQKDVMAACSVKEIPRLMAEIMAYDSMSAKACAFAILTAARSQAVRMARWDEFDLENALWVIPLEHDKLKFSNRDRTIFLSTWAVSLLKKLPRFVECPYVFPSARGSHFSDVALTMFLRGLHEKRVAKDGRGWIDPAKSARLGKPCIITLHGTARATFRTWAKDDVLGNNRRFDQQAVEMCLLHEKNDAYNGAYDRAPLAQERRKIMQAWGDYCMKEFRKK
jgi:integrase